MFWHMKTLALIAFISLQLSILACSTDIHMHPLMSQSANIEQPQTPADSDEQPVDYACQIHTVHTFIATADIGSNPSPRMPEAFYPFKTLPDFIVLHSLDRPPIG